MKELDNFIMKIPTEKVHTCSYCTPGVTHIIDSTRYPNDILAHKDDKGKWLCGNCIERELEDRIIRVTLESERAKQILEDRKREENKKFQMRIFEAKIRGMQGRIVKRLSK